MNQEYSKLKQIIASKQPEYVFSKFLNSYESVEELVENLDWFAEIDVIMRLIEVDDLALYNIEKQLVEKIINPSVLDTVRDIIGYTDKVRSDNIIFKNDHKKVMMKIDNIADKTDRYNNGNYEGGLHCILWNWMNVSRKPASNLLLAIASVKDNKIDDRPLQTLVLNTYKQNLVPLIKEAIKNYKSDE